MRPAVPPGPAGPKALGADAGDRPARLPSSAKQGGSPSRGLEAGQGKTAAAGGAEEIGRRGGDSPTCISFAASLQIYGGYMQRISPQTSKLTFTLPEEAGSSEPESASSRQPEAAPPRKNSLLSDVLRRNHGGTPNSSSGQARGSLRTYGSGANLDRAASPSPKLPRKSSLKSMTRVGPEAV